LYLRTSGLVTPVLLAGVIEWVVLVGLIVVVLGRLDARHLGLTRVDLGRAFAVLVPLWLSVQLLTAASCALEGNLVLRNQAIGFPPLYPIGLRLQAVFGSGLIEEVLYRGVLLSQVYLLVRARGASATAALVAGALATSAYFGLNHLPAALRMGLPAPD